jgi:2-O-(6-phospho-alpha-D-mannosyl)-D-glycerate hydrolase
MDHLYFVVHTHWDREWYQPFQRMRARLVAMTDRMLDLLEQGRIPCFHFDGQTIVLDDYLEVRPENAKRIARLVKAGKLQIGPWYLLADSFLPSGEALIRNLEIGAQVAERFGKAASIGYLPDQFGHAAQLPQILAGFGLEAAVVFRGVSREVKRNRFIWEALDGSSIVAIYLPFGYANGAALPADSADELIARTAEIAAREREFADGAPILIMNGNDHAEPDPRVFEQLAEARGRAPFSFGVGTIEEYARRLSELPLDGVAKVHGELRSPARANLTPGVTSVRAWIKQRDFQNSYLLERQADPLAAIANLSGRASGLGAFLDIAWRTEIQNHPHDSICGCSVDQVHQDMRYRFDQAAMIGENVVRQAIGEIFGDSRGEPALAVFNPTFARTALVTGETEVEDPDAHHVLVGSDGQRIPAAIDVAGRHRTFDIELKAPDFKAIAGGQSAEQTEGRSVHRFEVRRVDQDRFEVNLRLSRGASDVDIRELRCRIMEIPDDASVHLRMTTAARARVAFVADDLVQSGFSLYRVMPEASPVSNQSSSSGNLTPTPSLQGKGPESTNSVENEFYKVSPSERGLAIRDLKNRADLELHFEDEGDRGDEYNFDPVADSPPLATPESAVARAIERGPVRSRLRMSIVYRLPASLAADRRSRAQETVEVPVELTATLYAGLDRVDFEAMVDNRARDHRLRVALRTPVAADESVSDTSFGVVRRSIEPVEPAGISEDIYPTAPHRTFTAVESPDLSAAILSRGIYETEVRRECAGTTILLTLLRCVGWLSRSDLHTRRGDAGPQMETPDAQELGQHRFEFALTTWRGHYAQSELIQLSQAYAFPPRMFPVSSGSDFDRLRLCGCDNPRIVFSTARALSKAGRYMVRVFNESERAETARLAFGPGRAARLVDLAGRPVEEPKLKRRRDGSAEVSFRPFQIVTFQVRKRR